MQEKLARRKDCLDASTRKHRGGLAQPGTRSQAGRMEKRMRMEFTGEGGGITSTGREESVIGCLPQYGTGMKHWPNADASGLRSAARLRDLCNEAQRTATPSPGPKISPHVRLSRTQSQDNGGAEQKRPAVATSRYVTR
ncbi:unnamed protein product [Prorocentrum cordatum]|uniref:Uncharacterized protein n=1 Tax=Prorocentrum cordatum TaxID=2364126 RepID=A0ABN9RFA5_9DINO|nr:unnamed protein product [Polarella glacialis]